MYSNSKKKENKIMRIYKLELEQNNSKDDKNENL